MQHVSAQQLEQTNKTEEKVVIINPNPVPTENVNKFVKEWDQLVNRTKEQEFLTKNKGPNRKERRAQLKEDQKTARAKVRDKMSRMEKRLKQMGVETHAKKQISEGKWEELNNFNKTVRTYILAFASIVKGYRELATSNNITYEQLVRDYIVEKDMFKRSIELLSTDVQTLVKELDDVYLLHANRTGSASNMSEAEAILSISETYFNIQTRASTVLPISFDHLSDILVLTTERLANVNNAKKDVDYDDAELVDDGDDSVSSVEEDETTDKEEI